ncbi:MAG: hypothetical protein ACR2MW_07230 [Chthoniobacterales bacterium]
MKNFLKQTLRNPASIALALFVAVGVVGCGEGSAPEDVAASAEETVVPQDPLDGKINDYGKLVKDYRKVARKHAAGDVSVTLLYIDLRHQTETATAQLQQQSAQMKPAQARRLAKLSAAVAPYLKE